MLFMWFLPLLYSKNDHPISIKGQPQKQSYTKNQPTSNDCLNCHCGCEPPPASLAAAAEDVCQQNMDNNICLENYPKGASSCKETYDRNSNSPSGYYWRDSSPLELMYCAMNLTRCGSTTGGWTRVAHIDMTNPEGTCPSPLQTVYSPRSCSHGGRAGCSVYFSTFGVPFTKVCGQAIGYQHQSTDAFGAFYGGINIDNPYVDGLSITYYDNSSRQHLWTYAAGYSDSGISHVANCPCAEPSGTHPPSFVGDHYSCESGNIGALEDQWYPDDPLWDGEGCPTGNTCCDPPNLPWFNRMIDPPSTADIELRLCRDEAARNEDVSVELFELFVHWTGFRLHQH